MTLLHFLVTLLVYYSKDDNVRASLPLVHSSSDWNDNMKSFEAALGLSMACFAIELGALITGVSMFSPLLAIFGTSPWAALGMAHEC